MATIEEVVKWEASIYQIDTTDPVVGGPDGVANLAVRQLSNRTQYLKSVQDTYKEKTDTHLAGANPHPQYALLDSPVLVGTPKAPTPPITAVGQEIANAAFVLRLIESVVGSAPEALDTLKELADALGDDPNFAATVTTALAGKQPLDTKLTALSRLVSAADILPYFDGTDSIGTTSLTSTGRDIIGKNSVSSLLSYLGLTTNGNIGRLLGLRVISTSETYTKTAGTTFADVIAIGGGGGGGWASSSANYNSAAGGGGGGGMARKLVDLSTITNIDVIIGAGGNGGIASSRTHATPGGTTTFGVHLSAGGGNPGNSCMADTNCASCGMGGLGGTPIVGDLLGYGHAGLPGVMATPTAVGATVGSGLGGGSFISGSGGYGAGGNGAATNGGNQNVNGNPGNAGVVIVMEYA